MAKEKKPKKKHRGLWIFVRIQLVLMLFIVAGITYFYVGGYASTIEMMHSEATRFVSRSNESTFRQEETSIAYDSAGNVLSVLKGEKDVYYLSYPEIPIYVKEAIISIEDKKFYDHKGIDYKAIVRAAYSLWQTKKITQGGSTITQQLARTIFLTQDRTWERKIEEIYIALELEKRYTKTQILEFYLNNINFSNGYYGIEAAARGYFDVPSQELSLSQIAFLCSIPNSPTIYNPVTNHDGVISRRNLILRNMYDDGIISLQEYQNALIEEITLQRSSKVKHDYQETYMFYCATRAIMEAEGFEFKYEFNTPKEEKEYNEAYNDRFEACNAKLFQGGYRIYTSLDSDMQKQLQECLDVQLSINTETNEEGIYALQGSATCIDNETGMVKAIVGGRYQEYEGYTLNRAYQSYRQPCSAIKPLIVYAPALERGYSADTLLNDVRFEGGPANSDNVYLGEIPLRYAVEFSRNTTAWALFEDLGANTCLSYLRAMHFDKIVDSDYVPAASLGGFTHGASSLEMAEAYATLANEGYYREATCITKITDAKGNTIYQPSQAQISIYKEEAAREMTNILEGVFTYGTAKGLAVPGMNCAGKTGTSDDNKDGWFCGYTPYYTTAVWVGFDKPKKLTGLWGSTMPGRIWKNFMILAHRDLPNKPLHDQLIGVEPPTEEEEFEFSQDYFNMTGQNNTVPDNTEVVEIIEETTVTTITQE